MGCNLKDTTVAGVKRDTGARRGNDTQGEDQDGWCAEALLAPFAMGMDGSVSGKLVGGVGG
jgi:hypothetical protein